MYLLIFLACIVLLYITGSRLKPFPNARLVVYLTLIPLSLFSCWKLFEYVQVYFIVTQLKAHVQDGTPISGVENCRTNDALITWNTCAGRDHSFMQGRMWYIILEGAPSSELCKLYSDSDNLDTHEASSCMTNDPGSWKVVACDDYSTPLLSTCYACQYLTSTGDTYFNLISLDERCSKVTGLFSANKNIENVNFSEFKLP